MKGDNKLHSGWLHKLRFKDFDKNYGFTKKNVECLLKDELTMLQLAFSWPQKASNIR
jgi:hypothetical protein